MEVAEPCEAAGRDLPLGFDLPQARPAREHPGGHATPSAAASEELPAAVAEVSPQGAFRTAGL